MKQITSITLASWTEDMGEISGFGGGYEEACRRMVCAGVDWLIANGQDFVASGGGFTFGDDVVRRTFDDAVAAVETGCSGAMHGSASSHACAIFWKGWDHYAETMRARKRSQ